LGKERVSGTTRISGTLGLVLEKKGTKVKSMTGGGRAADVRLWSSAEAGPRNQNLQNTERAGQILRGFA